MIYAAMVLETVLWQWVSYRAWFPECSVFVGWPMGALVAMLVTVRFGLTLPAGRRLVRFLFISAAAALVLLPLDYPMGIKPEALLPPPMRPNHLYTYSSFSPNSRYAVGLFPDGWFHIVNRWGTVDVGPGSRQISPSGTVFHWAGPSTVYHVELVSVSPSPLPRGTTGGPGPPSAPPSQGGESRNRIEVSRLDERLNLLENLIPVLPSWHGLAVLVPSPSGRRALAVPVGEMRYLGWRSETLGTRLVPGVRTWAAGLAGGEQEFDVVDIPSGKVLARQRANATNYWWQSENQVGYLDETGARKIISVR